MTGHKLSGFLVVGIALGFAACGGDSLTIPPTTGTLEITTTTSGTEPDGDGYILQIDAQQPQAIGAAATLSIDELAPGAHSVVLTGIAPNCSVAGDNPRTVTIAVGEITTAQFELNCGATTGAITVTTQTGGPAPDPDGYNITLDDGTDRGPIGTNATVTLSNLTPGSHVIGLAGLAANCQLQGENFRVVTVGSGQTATVEFSVTCGPLPPSVGTIHITTITSGQDQDANGYRFAVDGGTAEAIGINGSKDVASVSAGPHSVTLSDVASNCAADELSKDVTVIAGATSNVTFSITCTAILPTTGNIRVTTVTSGQSQDANGYRFTVDAGASQSIGPNETKQVTDLAAGIHVVTLSDLAANCASIELSKNVTVVASETADVNFTIVCNPVPSASESNVSVGSDNISAGSSTSITVTVKDAGGNLLSGITVAPTSSGSGDVITPTSAITNANGVAEFTFSSNVAERQKTITVVAGGVTLKDKPVISVSSVGTSTEITNVQPEPSTSGESIHVTFQVTTDDGGTPTGTVTIFSLDETGGCTVDVSLGSCDFTLNTATIHHLGATYSGDSKYDDSSDLDGWNHEVISVTAINQAPVADDDSYTGTVGTPLVVSDESMGLLANDIDPEGDIKSIASHTDPTNGTLDLANNGTFTYTPVDVSITSDAFSYTVQDDKGAIGSSASVAINLEQSAGLAMR